MSNQIYSNETELYPFIQSKTPIYSQTNANVPAPAGADTEVYNQDLGVLNDGDYAVEIYVQWTNGVIGADADFNIVFKRVNDVTGTTTLETTFRKQLATLSSKEEVFILKAIVPIPQGATTNSFTINFDNQGSLATQTKNRASVIMYALF